jgi:hypothetical protein
VLTYVKLQLLFHQLDELPHAFGFAASVSVAAVAAAVAGAVAAAAAVAAAVAVAVAAVGKASSLGLVVATA